MPEAGKLPAMRKAAHYNIFAFVQFLIPLVFFGSCDTDDVVIDGKGINADSTLVYIDAAAGSKNSFVLSSLYPWEVGFLYERDSEWLTVSPRDYNEGTTITVTGTENIYRRRSGYLVFDNGMYTYTVQVIQRAPEIYEPGTVILSENFGMTEVEGRTSVSSFVSWGKTGTGSSSASYSGSGAVVQAGVTSLTDPTRPTDDVLKGLAYPDATGGNNIEIASGGNFTISRIGVSSATHFILTVYIAAQDTGAYIPEPEDMLSISGGNIEDFLYDIPFDVVELSEDRGWKKIVAEFRKVEGASSFYLRFGNNGSLPLYMDDILLEAAGPSELVIGTYVPTVTTLAASDNTGTSVTLRGLYTLPSAITRVDRAGIEYRLNTDTEYLFTDVSRTASGEEFHLRLNGLTDGDIYFFRAYAVVDGYTTYGEALSVTVGEAGDEDIVDED